MTSGELWFTVVMAVAAVFSARRLWRFGRTWEPHRAGPAGVYCRAHIGRPRPIVFVYDREREDVR